MNHVMPSTKHSCVYFLSNTSNHTFCCTGDGAISHFLAHLFFIFLTSLVFILSFMLLGCLACGFCTNLILLRRHVRYVLRFNPQFIGTCPAAAPSVHDLMRLLLIILPQLALLYDRFILIIILYLLNKLYCVRMPLMALFSV